jgi:large subunit ribosomal protein L25
MKVAHSFEAASREGSGKGAARALRRENRVPAIVYGGHSEAIKISLPVKEMTLAFHKGSFFNKIVDIRVDGKVIHALPRDVQLHPLTDMIEHADFQQVTDEQTIHVMVPVKVVGADRSVGIKRGGVLNLVRHEIEMICRAANIPDEIEINVADLNIGGSIHIVDVPLPEDAKPAIKRNFTIATIAGRKAEEEAAPAAAAATAEGAAAPAAGAAAPAAGAAAPAAAEAKPAAKK